MSSNTWGDQYPPVWASVMHLILWDQRESATFLSFRKGTAILATITTQTAREDREMWKMNEHEDVHGVMTFRITTTLGTSLSIGICIIYINGPLIHFHSNLSARSCGQQIQSKPTVMFPFDDTLIYKYRYLYYLIIFSIHHLKCMKPYTILHLRCNSAMPRPTANVPTSSVLSRPRRRLLSCHGPRIHGTMHWSSFPPTCTHHSTEKCL